MLTRVLPTHYLPKKKKKKHPSHKHWFESVPSDNRVNPPFGRRALTLFDRDQSFRRAALQASAQRVASWLRKRSELQRGLRMRCRVRFRFRGIFWAQHWCYNRLCDLLKSFPLEPRRQSISRIYNILTF